MSDPDFGPRGHLPGRAATRARKIVLREQMGVGWPAAAVAAGGVLLAVAVAFAVLRTVPPGVPYERVALVEDLGRDVAVVVATDAGPALVVRGGGGALRAFAAPDGAVRWCDESRRLEGADGAVWTPEGVRVSDGAGVGSLAPLPAAVHDGALYVDATAPAAALPASPVGARPTCDASAG